MSKPALSLVAKPAIPIPFDPAKGKKRVEALRAQLLVAATRYIKEGGDRKHQGDRIREMSDTAGIPTAQLEVEARRG